MNSIETENLFFSRSKHTTPNIREKPNNENYKLPMPTHCLGDKKYCAKEYAGLMSMSNKNLNENHRYLYKNKIDMEELAKELGIGKKTLQKNINKLIKLEYNILEVKNTDVGVVYKLNYGEKKNNSEYTKYVTIHHQILKVLANTFNSNTIKLYCLLNYMTDETSFKPMTNVWLAEQIGLSSKSKNNLDVITDIATQLELCGFIETRKENIYKWDNKKKREVPQISKSYRLRTLKEWEFLQKRVKNKKVIN